MELNQKISTAKADIKAHEMRIKFLHKSMKEKQAASQKQDTLFAETSARLQSAEKQLQAVQAKARGLGFDEGAATDCQRELDTLAKQVSWPPQPPLPPGCCVCVCARRPPADRQMCRGFSL